MKKPSLALIPSGYKAGKVYSILPNNGDGDFTFTRNSGATRVNKDGLIENVGETLGAELVTNGYFDTDTDWIKQNGSTISGGVANVIANGSIGSTGLNRGVQQNNVFVAGNLYEITFRARQTVGSGKFQIGNGFTILFDKVITSEFVTYSFRAFAGAINLQDHILAIGGRTVSDEFELTYISVKQVLTEVNVPRLDYTDAGCPSLLLEPQRTNYVQNQNVDSYAQNLADVTLSSNLSPDGSINCFRVEGTSSGLRVGIATFATTIGNTYTGSVYVRKVSGSDTAQIVDVDFASPTTINITTEWQRFDITRTATQTTGRIFVNVSQIGDVIEVFGFQIEEGSYSTSYIPTNGSISTRAADLCADSGDADLFDITEGTFFVDVTPYDSGNFTTIGLSIGNDTQKIVFIFQSNGTQVRIFSSGGVSSYLSLTFDQRNKIAVTFKENEYKFFVNGALVGSDTSATVPIGMNRLNFSNRTNTANHFEGKVYDTRVYDRVLTEAEAITLTTL
jgi:hypothetical protein